MTNNLPTPEAAAAYVIDVETSWGLASRVLSVELDCENEGCLEVWTEANTWSVWIEGIDGTLYGEC